MRTTRKHISQAMRHHRVFGQLWYGSLGGTMGWWLQRPGNTRIFSVYLGGNAETAVENIIGGINV